MTGGTRIVVDRVAKSYGDPPLGALEEVCFTAEPGTITAVVGASGSGKSSLLRLIGGLDTPTDGAISIGEQSPDEIRRSKGIGWMAQHPALLPWRTVAENVSLAQTINIRPGRPLPDPDNLIELVGLAEFESALPGTLSGGMQQRAALARTLAIGAAVWLMDEPFASLDELTRQSLGDDLLDMRVRFAPTVVWVTHHIPEAVRLADQVVVLTPRPGRVAGTVPVGLNRPRDDTALPFQDVVREIRDLLQGGRVATQLGAAR